MSLPAIRTLVPQSGRMVLLDRVISVDEDGLWAEVGIRSDSLFCTRAGVGAWVGIEYMAQTIGAYVGYTAQLRGDPIRIGFLLGVRRYECTRPIFPLGTTLRIHVRRVWQSENGLGSFECRIHDSTEEQVATATVSVFQPDNAGDFLRGVENE